MPAPTLAEIEVAVRAAWGPDTAYASHAYMSRSSTPSRGQCGTTALVVHELLGGDLMVADLEHDGRVDAVHYWNVLPGGVEVDLTRDQLTADERLVDPRRVVVPRDRSSPGEAAYRVLRARVDRSLAAAAPASPSLTSGRESAEDPGEVG